MCDRLGEIGHDRVAREVEGGVEKNIKCDPADFLLFTHYSHATLIDHGKEYVQSVSCPQSARGGS